jgi:fumarate reductase subunit C
MTTERPSYTEYHPRWYRRRVSTYWWLGRWTYVAFILRELSSLFVGWFILFTLLLVHAVSQGEVAYRAFLAWSREPVVLAFNVLTLFFVVFHAITWFNLAPQAMAVRLRGQRVPGSWIAGSNYLLWALVSALVAWLLLGG